MIQKAAEDSANEGLGYLLSENQLQFHQSILPQLPLILRCYVACATVLYGDIESADLIKIHIDTGKLTIQSFENFADPLPLLEKRIKIDMNNKNALVEKLAFLKIDLIVIGPEIPLANGLADFFRKKNFKVFGPGKDGAKLESS